MSLPAKIAYKIHQRVTCWRERTARPFSPDDDAAFRKISAEIEAVTGKRSPRIYHRLGEIARFVERYDVRSIDEFGTGRSTIAFGLLARHRSLNVVSYEQDPEWFSMMDRIVAEYGLDVSVRLADVEPFTNGFRFVAEARDVDMLYIDGPFALEKKPRTTFTGKPPYYDFARYFDAGIFPRLVVVEGKTDTVDAVLAHPEAGRYRLRSEFIWAYERGKYGQALAARRHSVFSRR